MFCASFQWLARPFSRSPARPQVDRHRDELQQSHARESEIRQLLEAELGRSAELERGLRQAGEERVTQLRRQFEFQLAKLQQQWDDYRTQLLAEKASAVVHRLSC